MNRILNNRYFKYIIVLLLVSFAGCVTSKIEYVDSDKVPNDKTFRISKLYLKDGSVIDVKDKEAKFKMKYKGNENGIVYFEDVNIEKYVLLKDIDRLKIEILESNIVVTALVISGVIAASAILVFLLISSLGKFKAG